MHIRNKTIEALESEDLPMLAYRFLQSRKGKNSARNEVIYFCTGTSFLSIFLAYISFLPDEAPNDVSQMEDNNTDYSWISSYCAVAAGGYQAVLSRENLKSFAETHQYTRDFLLEHVSEERFKTIEKLRYGRKGLFTLVEMFDEEEYDVRELREKLFNISM